MRYSVLLLLSALLLSSCSGIKETPRAVLITGYDFTEFNKQGFLITPEGYSGPYESVGIFNARITPEVKKAPQVSGNMKNPAPLVDRQRYYSVFADGNEWFIENIDNESTIRELYKQAVAMGADAIIRFKVDIETQYNGSLSYPVYVVSGFAIKRKSGV
jgi:hypothetical protein